MFQRCEDLLRASADITMMVQPGPGKVPEISNRFRLGESIQAGTPRVIREMANELEQVRAERDEARAELALTRAALSTPEGYRGQVAEAVADELEKARAEAAALRAQVAELIANGVSTHKTAARERAAIVAWLRREADRSMTIMQGPGQTYYRISDAIERGEHIPDEVTRG
jgi:ribonuclease D